MGTTYKATNNFSMENKDIKNVERPTPLTTKILELRPNSTLKVYTSAYKVQMVRVTCSYLNKKFGRKVFTVSDKGIVDHCIVTRLS